MADKKISALTAATTPLAGTEVLPIVQSGATVKVAVSDLTAGRAISATAVGAGVTTTAAGVTVEGRNGASGTALRASNSGGGFAEISCTSNATSEGKITYTNQMTVSGGNFVLNGSNFVVGTSGKGITDSTGVTLLSFTTQQVESNKPIQATAIRTTSGLTASTASATPVTLFAVSGDSVWIVNAAVTGTGAPAAYTAVAIVKSSGGVAAATPISAATNLTITVSGLNVQATQTSGVAQIMGYSAVRLF